MRKIQAICTLGDATKFIRPGEVIDVSDVEAEVLVQRGFARYAEDPKNDLQPTDVRNQIDLLDEVVDNQDPDSDSIVDVIELIDGTPVDIVDAIDAVIVEDVVEESKPVKGGKKAKSK